MAQGDTRGTIPAGLRADYMRKRMEDKATIHVTGSLYVGGDTTIQLHEDNTNTTIDAQETVELVPGGAGLPLVSKGSEQIPEYTTIKTAGIADAAITKAKLGNGAVINGNDDGNKKILKIETDGDVLTIRYYNA